MMGEKNKQFLLLLYECMDPTALEHSKDKFLVQSCFFGKEFVQNEAKVFTESITAMWNRTGTKAEAILCTTRNFTCVTAFSGAKPVVRKKAVVKIAI